VNLACIHRGSLSSPGREPPLAKEPTMDKETYVWIAGIIIAIALVMLVVASDYTHINLNEERIAILEGRVSALENQLKKPTVLLMELDSKGEWTAKVEPQKEGKEDVKGKD